MSKGTSIEWARDSWNVVTGCDRVSPGCDFCYAQTLAKRLKAMGNPRYQQDGDPRTSGPGFGVTLHPDKLDEPLRSRKPSVFFVNSMSDLFHQDVPDLFIAKVFAIMGEARQHTFQVLTKRPRRMARLIRNRQFTTMVLEQLSKTPGQPAEFDWPLPNVWLGTSVEDQKRAELRIPHLLQAQASVRFLSCEPLLGPVDLGQWLRHGPVGGVDSSQGMSSGETRISQILHWVIVGGESGAHLWQDASRALVAYDPSEGAWLPKPERTDWVKLIRDQCQSAGVPFFFKQWGGNIPKAGGRVLAGRAWNEMPHGASRLVQPSTGAL